MTNATTTVIARVAAAVAGIALVATSILPMAFAQTMTTTSASASATFSRDLTIGSTGADVTALQNWLINKGHTIAAGATGYFGAQTKAALAAYQAANGIAPAAGYFGPITRAKVMAAGGSTTGGSTGGSTSGDLGGGESSLEDLNATSGSDDDVEEGMEAEIAEFEFDVEDGDARIERLDLTFEVTADAGEEDEPWETFDTITISDADGNELASEDVSDEDEWLDEDEPYVFRFTGLDYVVEEGDMATLVVTVEAQNGIDGVSAGDIAWEVYIDTDGVRATDGEGVEQYVGDADESVSFDVTEEGDNDDLSVRRSSEDPDATTLMVEDDTTSDWYTIFAFDLDSDDDSSDIEVNEIALDLVTSGTSTANVVNDIKLVVDGQDFDDFTRSSATTTTTTYTFDTEDEELVVEGGERTMVEVMVEFKAQSATTYANGQTVSATVDGSDIDAEGADDITVDGSATSDTHTLRATGVNVDVTSDSATTQVVDGTDNDYATFTLKVDVEAFDQDVYISKNAGTAFTYQLEDSSGNVSTTSTATSSAVSSSADESGSFYVVNEGSTEEFTFQVTYNPITTDEGDFYRMQILTIEFNDTATTPDTTYTASPASDFETDSTVIND